MVNVGQPNLVILCNILLLKHGAVLGRFFLENFDFLSLLHEGIHELLLRTDLIHLFYLYLFIFVIPHEGFFGALKIP